MSAIDHVAELAAIEDWKAGDILAGGRLLKMHAGLIVIAVRRHRLTRCPMEDLVQVGSMTLLHAAKKFDPALGISFATYAVRAMRNAALSHRREMTADISGCGTAHGAASELRSPRADGRPLSASVATTIRNNVVVLRQLQRPAVRLDAPRTIGEDSTHVDLLEGDNVPVDEALGDLHERAELDALIAELTPFEQEIVHRRYLADEPETLEEIGDSKGLSRERIRQIEEKAIATMRRRAERKNARSTC